jgi:hypothetical protein
VVALVAAAAGTALAGPDASTSAVTKKKVKKIATKQVQKLAPELSVANSAALGGKPANAYATTASEPFRNVGTPGQPPFLNGWSNETAAFYPAGFYKDSQGFVHLRGSVTGDDDDGAAFTLPAGYRPSKLAKVPGACGTGGFVAVESNGNVNPVCSEDAGGFSFGLDGIAFKVP